MIIFRYITREILTTTFAVTAVLMLIITSARLIKYLADAAAGKIEPGAVFLILFYRIPGFLELLLPLGLFLGILLAIGRLCLDSEMAVLRATGFSTNRIIKSTLGATVVIMMLVSALSLWLSPIGFKEAETLLAQQQARSEFDLMTPGRFLTLSGRSVYAESVSAEKLEKVFVTQRNKDGSPTLLIAKEAHRDLNEETGQTFIVLNQGYRFDVTPGVPEATRTQYDEYGFLFQRPALSIEIRDVDAMSTRALWSGTDARETAALHWRVSLAFLVVIVTLLAVPLGFTNPRQGRFAKLIPAILLYLVYMSLLLSARSRLEEGQPVWIFWGVHGIFLLVALSFIYGGSFWRKISQFLLLPVTLRKVSGVVNEGKS